MNRTRRVTATVVAATGLLGAAGAAAATVAGLTGDKSSEDNVRVSAAAISGRHAQSAAGQADASGRTALEDYIAGMSQRANLLGARVTAAEVRLMAARTTRVRRIAHVRAQSAALARARVAAEVSTPTSRNKQSSAPATHTSTGASSGGHGEDDHGDGGGGDD